MNDKSRARFLKLRQRADALELEAIELREEQARILERVSQAQRKLDADQAQATNEAMMSRQRDARKETIISRLIDALNELSPHIEAETGRILPERWREVVTDETLWLNLSHQFRQHDALLDSATQGTGATFTTPGTRPTFKVAPDGQSVSFIGGGGASSFASAFAAPLAGGPGASSHWVRTDDERRAR